MKLGLVTYEMGSRMDLTRLITFCETTGLEGVELRAEHAHGVELHLTKPQRDDVKKMFENSSVALVGLGSIYEYHSDDPDEVRRNIEGSKAYARLAADVGATGIKVRPNGLLVSKGIPAEKTCEQIGLALREVAESAAGIGIEVRLEVHDNLTGTKDPKLIRKIMDAADHPNALVCWNSNVGEDDENGSIKTNFDLLKHKIALVHITDIGVYQYPWQELFDRLKAIGYKGYCLAEIAHNPEPERFMTYYRTMFDLYTGRYEYPQQPRLERTKE